MANREWFTREGEPSHFHLLRFAWQQFLCARHAFRDVCLSDRHSIAGACERDHAHGRMVQSLLIVQEMCDICLDNEWPIPVEIEIGVATPEEEGQ